MTASLFERLGKTEGITALVDDIAALHLENPTIRARFLPFAARPDGIPMLKDHLCRFLEAGSGGPVRYQGRSMPEAHKGMNVSDAEYMAALDDIMLAMKKHRIDEQTQKDVLFIAWSLKAEIVRM